MTYDEAIFFVHSTLRFGSKPGLESISRLCELIGNPQDKLRFIHVAGTNGKGSTSAMLASVLHAAGYKTGLFLSPYMDDYCDSIQINGVFMSRDEFAGTVSAVKEQTEKMAQNGEHATEFEILTAIAFLWFYQSGCDIAVLEAGLGGRLDATNIIKNPLVSVITAISFDHMAYLGNTIEEIAREKCGIIKPGGVTVSYPLQYEDALAVIKEYASKKNNLLLIPDADAVDIEKAGLNGTDISYKGSKFHIPLSGRHQIYNALSAVEAIFALCDFFGFAISRSDIKKGIENTVIPARQEVLCRHPLIILDGAHNTDGIKTLAESIKNNLGKRRIAVIMGMLADKEYEQSIALIASLCQKFIAVKPDNPRALEASITAGVAKKSCDNVSMHDDYREAVDDAIKFSGRGGAVIICGSLYLASPMRKAVLGH